MDGNNIHTTDTYREEEGTEEEEDGEEEEDREEEPRSRTEITPRIHPDQNEPFTIDNHEGQDSQEGFFALPTTLQERLQPSTDHDERNRLSPPALSRTTNTSSINHNDNDNNHDDTYNDEYSQYSSAQTMSRLQTTRLRRDMERHEQQRMFESTARIDGAMDGFHSRVNNTEDYLSAQVNRLSSRNQRGVRNDGDQTPARTGNGRSSFISRLTRTARVADQATVIAQIEREMARSDLEDSHSTRHDLDWWDSSFDARPPSTSVRRHHNRSAKTTASPLLEMAVMYLDRLKSCHDYTDAVLAASLAGLDNKEFLFDKHDDFIMELDLLDATSMSSWFRGGIKYRGWQHTTTPSSTRMLSDIESRLVFGHWIDPPGSTTNLSTARTRPTPDRWPVKVSIYQVDEERMTIAGTMEAHDLPSHFYSRDSINKLNIPVTTFLDGQIIDLTNHSFLTPTNSKKSPPDPSTDLFTTDKLLNSAIIFPSTSAIIDASNWRRLPPFDQLKDDDQVARAMLSKTRMMEIRKEYIHMRWKERCFVKNSIPSVNAMSSNSDGQHKSSTTSEIGHGLTISGFYYISLHRLTGDIEGLYYDPNTSPYQCLRLKGVGGGLVGAWELR